MENCSMQSGILKYGSKVYLWFYSSASCHPQIYVKPLTDNKIVTLSEFLKENKGKIELYNNSEIPDLAFRSIIMNINSNNERDGLMSLYEMLLGARIQKLFTDFKPQTQTDIDTMIEQSKSLLKDSMTADQILEILEKEFFKKCAFN